MRLSRNRFRMLYAALLIAAFFIPAYSHLSGFRFIVLAIGALHTDPEVTFIDLLVILLPLVFIPLSASLILVRAARHQRCNGLLLSLPFFFLLFFSIILSFDINRQADTINLGHLLNDISFGFYVAALASVLLLFSYSKREMLNFGNKH